MSELKDYSILDIEAIDDERYEKEKAAGKWVTESRVYLKSEADKVIAEKDAEIAQLQAMLEERNKQVGELKYELAVATGDCQALAGKFGG